MEPDRHYFWDIGQVKNGDVNVLFGRSPSKGSEYCEEKEWDGWKDPLFKEALDVVKEALNSKVFNWDLKSFFKLQMAYLLLWSSIERYVSLRYHLGNKVTEKVGQLGFERAFAESLRKYVKDSREVYRADQPDKKEILDPNSPNKSVSYYYQVRSNIIHRGKGVVKDYDLLSNSLAELLPIFRDVLKAAEIDSRYQSKK